MGADGIELPAFALHGRFDHHETINQALCAIGHTCTQRVESYLEQMSCDKLRIASRAKNNGNNKLFPYSGFSGAVRISVFSTIPPRFSMER